MGRRIRAQRIGRGSSAFKASLKRKFALGYPSMIIRSAELALGYVRELHHDPGRGAPVAEVVLEKGESFAVAAVEGLHVGQIVEMGANASLKPGNIIPLGKAPEGMMVSMVELEPGDGGKLVRAPGTYATVMSQLGDKTILLMPSKKMVEVSSKSLAIIGAVAGGGLHDKPFLKAGKKYHLMKAKHKPYPRTRGVAMVPALHPFGGTRKKIGRPETVPRNAPPGRKVGLIAAKRTGRRKR